MSAAAKKSGSFEHKGGQFAPGGGRVPAGPGKAKPASSHSGAALDAKAEKTAKRYAARAKFWNQKHAEFHAKAKAATNDIERQAHLKSAQQAQKKAGQAHEKVKKAVGEDHPLAQESKKHSDSVAKRSGKPAESPKASQEHVTEAKKTDIPQLDAKAEKTAKRYAARAKFWEKKHAEFTEKAKNATNDVERQAHLKAAKEAQSKANSASKKVEKIAGADHPLTKQAKESATKTGAPATKSETPKPQAPAPALAQPKANPPGQGLTTIGEKDSHGGKIGTIVKTEGGAPTGYHEMSPHTFSKEGSKFASSLTPSEVTAVKAYTGPHYRDMNSKLRQQKHAELNDKQKQTMNDLDSALAKTSLPHNTTLYRGAGNDTYDKFSSLSVGSSFTDHGYGSTAYKPEKAWPGRVQFTIYAKQGQKGGHVDKVSANQGEAEVVIPRGTKYRVMAMEHGEKSHDGGVTVTKTLRLHVEIVDE